MNTFLSLVAVLTLLVVGVWIVLFGLLGAIVGRRRGRSGLHGALLGVLAGPLALAWMLVRDVSDRAKDDAVAHTEGSEELLGTSNWVRNDPWSPSDHSHDADNPFADDPF